MARFLLTLVLTFAFAALAGCATYEWRHSTKNQADFDSDRNQCQYEAAKATSYYAPNFPAQVEQQQQRNQLFNMCMRNKGYYMVKKGEEIKASSQEEMEQTARKISNALKNKGAQK